jgi:hypothetical protein
MQTDTSKRMGNPTKQAASERRSTENKVQGMAIRGAEPIGSCGFSVWRLLLAQTPYAAKHNPFAFIREANVFE